MKKVKKILIFAVLILFNNNTMSAENTTIYDYKFIDIDGNSIDLSVFKGKPLLLVNTASRCGFTPQYEGLEELHQKHKEALLLIGLPCNQFGRQEPGTAKEIQEFCTKNYDISFLLTEKAEVKGRGQHKLYSWLTDEKLNGKSSSSVKWNFQKYLVDEQGRFIDYYMSTTKPMSSKITKYL